MSMSVLQRLVRLSVSQKLCTVSNQFVPFLAKQSFASVDVVGPLHQDKMELNSVVSRLDAFAPPKLAEEWDNVGLLVEPSKPHDMIKRIMLTSMA